MERKQRIDHCCSARSVGFDGEKEEKRVGWDLRRGRERKIFGAREAEWALATHKV